MKLNVVIGLVAKPGGGKGTFPKLLRDACSADNYFPGIGGPRFSDALRATLAYYDVLDSRTNLQDLASWLNGRKAGAVANGMRRKLEEDDHEIKIADGVRWTYDEKMIREFSSGFLVYVKADPALRFQRIKSRAENSGDREKTWEKFLEEDNAETERFVEEIGSRADCVIDNNCTLEQYRAQVDGFYRKFLKPLREHRDD